MSTGKIYGLRAVDDQQVRYVGQTRQELEDRLTAHFNYARNTASNTPICQWLRAADRDKLEVIELESNVAVDRLNEREEHWIVELKTLVSHGGLNVRLGYGWEGGRQEPAPLRELEELTVDEKRERWKSRLADAARRELEANPEHRVAWLAAGQAYNLSAEGREATSRRSAAMWADEDHREDVVKKLRARAQTPEGKAALKRAAAAGASKAGKVSAHRRWHVGRDVFKPTCQLCVDEATPEIRPDA